MQLRLTYAFITASFTGMLCALGLCVPSQAPAALVAPPEERAPDLTASDSAAAAELPVASGSLVLRVGGLPRTARASIIVTGPTLPPRSSDQFRRRISAVGVTRLKGLRAGAYRISVRRVRLERDSGTIQRGAIAYPAKQRYRVGVHAHKGRVVDIHYGSIVNPGVNSVTGEVDRIIGDPLTPSGIVLSNR